MSLAAETRLGPYEILAPLGAGGMGEVYRARDTRLRRDVAIKVLPQAIANGAAWERFEREARAASALNHPNICAVFDVGEADGRQFLVMELLEGKTLRDYIGKEPANPALAVALAVQIADALEAAHAKGIIHRDIKPGNIMVTGREHVKVLDFGLAKHASAMIDETRTLDSLTAAGTVVGTPSYIAPEILQGKDADARSDLWALGVVLYEMLSGRLPFRGTTMFEVSSGILREDPPPLPSTVPHKLRGIVERCLQKDPAERYQNASDVRAALKSAAAPAVASRMRWLWVAGVAAVLAAGVYIWQQQRPATGGRLTSTGAPASANREANEAFELAMQFERVQNDLPRAQETLERALVLDPRFAEARRYHGFNYIIQVVNGYSNDTSLAYKAEVELQQAAQLDPSLISLPSAFTGVYLMQGRKELVPAEQLDRVLQQQPSNNDTRLWRAILRQLAGKNAAAREDLRIILDREPLNGPARMFLGETLRMERDLPGAIQQQQQVLEQAPGNMSAIRNLALAYMDNGELEKARALLDAKRSMFPGNYMWRATWALLLALEGKRQEALLIMDDETLKFLSASVVTTLGAAEFYAVLGNTPKALEWLEKVVRNGDERVEWFRKDPLLANIRQDPRFQQILDPIETRRKQQQSH
jgi:tRNA A-37 threonylcarbamoyl transferase component Bud32/Flp pilus assembly protein TadD